MSTPSKRRGFTTAILHSDRDAGIEHGALHKPVHCRSLTAIATRATSPPFSRGVRRATRTGGRAIRPPRRSKPRSRAMEEGVATRLFRHRHGGDRRDAVRAARAPAITSSPANTCSATPSACSARSHRTAPTSTYVDATDADAVERAIRRRRGSCSWRRSPIRARRSPTSRASARCVRARGILFVVDNTMTSPALFRPKAVGAGIVVNALTKYIGGHGNALGGSVTETGLFDWTAVPEHRRQYRAQSPRCGASSKSEEGAARLGRGRSRPSRRITLPSAPRRSRCGWNERAPTRRRSPICWRASEGRARSIIPVSRTHPQHALAKKLFRRVRRAPFASSSPTASTVRIPEPARVVVLSSNLGDNRTLAIPVAHTIY